MNIEKWVQNNTIHQIIAGSHLYGTSRPDSDVDIRGVCLAPKETLIGLSNFEQFQKDEPDLVIYELRRFCHLALNANPNILDILFAPEEVWQVFDSRWMIIYKHRQAFLSQKVRHTFSGYAISQLKRICGHRVWLTDPPDHQPTQEEFGGIWDGSTFQFPKTAREKEYQTARQKWNQYQKWLAERNPKRAELEKKYGYDTKHAGHPVRLMGKAEGLLLFGTYSPRLDSSELQMVKGVLEGGWEYETLVNWAERMDTTIHEMHSPLPNKPNRKLIEKLCIGIYLDEWRNNGNPNSNY